MEIRINFSGGGAKQFAEAVEGLSKNDAKTAYMRALNRTGRTAKTRVVRTVAKQVGLTQKRVKALGALREKRASRNNLEWSLTSEGKHIPLKEFKPKQFKRGTRAKAWGETKLYEGAFINAGYWNSRNPVADGHVLTRAGSRIDIRVGSLSWRSFQPFRITYGPAIPNEIVKDDSEAAFEEASKGLMDRLRHEVTYLTKGKVS